MADRLTPAWRCIIGGCDQNRAILALIEGAGFRFDRVKTGYMPAEANCLHLRRQCSVGLIQARGCIAIIGEYSAHLINRQMPAAHS
jgi:hypothetical protein